MARVGRQTILYDRPPVIALLLSRDAPVGGDDRGTVVEYRLPSDARHHSHLLTSQ